MIYFESAEGTTCKPETRKLLDEYQVAFTQYVNTGNPQKLNEVEAKIIALMERG